MADTKSILQDLITPKLLFHFVCSFSTYNSFGYLFYMSSPSKVKDIECDKFHYNITSDVLNRKEDDTVVEAFACVDNVKNLFATPPR